MNAESGALVSNLMSVNTTAWTLRLINWPTLSSSQLHYWALKAGLRGASCTELTHNGPNL